MEKLDITVKNVGNVLDTIKVHETENYIRKRQFDPSQCEKGSYRTFKIGKGKKAVGCKVNGKFQVQSVLEPKGKGDLTEDYPVQEHTRNEGVVKVKAHVRGESKAYIQELRDTLRAYGLLIRWDEIESDSDLQKEFFHLLSDLQNICIEHTSKDFTEDFIEMDKQIDVTNQFPDLKGDFTVLYGPIMRDGEFDYIDKKTNKKITLQKDWANLKEVSKSKVYIPARATEEDGAHQAPILGFAYGFEPREETHQIYAKTVLLNDYKDLPKEGSQVSIGFPDEIVGNKQFVKDLDHLAISLRNKEQGRCKKEGFTDCFQKVIETHDQNLIKEEVVN